MSDAKILLQLNKSM